MAEAKKVEAYRATLHRAAKTGRQAETPREKQTLAHLEGKAAKLGLEIQGEESKAALKPKSKMKGEIEPCRGAAPKASAKKAAATRKRRAG